MRHSPPCLEGYGLLSASSRIGDRADFWKTRASYPQTSRTGPSCFSQPHESGSRSGFPSFSSSGRLGRSCGRHHPEASAGSRPPPPARASCHVAQGSGARHCGAGPRGGPYQRPPPLPTHIVVSLFWTRANSKRPFPRFSNQSNTEAKQAAGKPTPQREGGGTTAQEPPSLTLLSLSSPLLEGRPHPPIQFSPPTYPTPPREQSESPGGCALQRL